MMKRLIKRGGRTFLAGAGLCLGALTGCQTPGTQLATPWAGRMYEQPNAVAGMMPASPAFSRVQAGQNLPVMQPGMMQPQMAMAPGYPQPGMMQPQMMPQQMMAQQPVMGSGGMVYPVSYQQGQPVMMAPPMQQMQPMQQLQQMAPPPGMTYAPQPGPATVYTPAAPVMQAPPIVPASQPGASLPQPGVTVTQGPNGPVTVTTEIFDQPPTANGNPTFNPPAPYTVPMPEAPALAPLGRAPDLLPNTVGKAPAGPALPAFPGQNPAPGLGGYPAVPAGHQQPAPQPKLPAPTGPLSEDDIPSAPIFLPGK